MPGFKCSHRAQPVSPGGGDAGPALPVRQLGVGGGCTASSWPRVLRLQLTGWECACFHHRLPPTRPWEHEAGACPRSSDPGTASAAVGSVGWGPGGSEPRAQEQRPAATGLSGGRHQADRRVCSHVLLPLKTAQALQTNSSAEGSLEKLGEQDTVIKGGGESTTVKNCLVKSENPAPAGVAQWLSTSP